MFVHIFLQLIRRDMVILRKEYIGKLVDLLITFVTWVIALGYLMPTPGATAGFGVFIMVGAIASFGIFEVIGQASIIINDIKGDRTISYLLLLPIRSSAVFFAQAVSWAVQTLLLALPLYVAGKLIFWQQFDLSAITWSYFVPALVTTTLFFGVFSLWIAGALTNIRDLSRLYFRFISPLFIFGCYFFSWEKAYSISPAFAYVVLIDPFSYVMEIMRASLIGQEGFLPYWVSFGALWFFILICGWHGIRRLKAQLDCL